MTDGTINVFAENRSTMAGKKRFIVCRQVTWKKTMRERAVGKKFLLYDNVGYWLNKNLINVVIRVIKPQEK